MCSEMPFSATFDVQHYVGLAEYFTLFISQFLQSIEIIVLLLDSVGFEV